MEQSPLVYIHDGHIFYRASALGMCPRALFAARTGLQPTRLPDNIQKAFDEGNESEPMAIAQLRANGFTITGEQREVILPITETISVIGHVDGIVVKPSVIPDVALALLEVKAFSTSTLNTWYKEKLDNFPHYKWQLSSYVLGLGFDTILFVIFHKDEPDVKKRLKLFKINVDNLYNKGQIIARIRLIEDAVAANKMPECEPPTFFCPYVYMHEEKAAEVEHAEVIPADSDLDILLGKYIAATNIQKKMGDFVQELRKQILAAGVTNGRSTKHTLVVKEIASETLDREKLSQFLDNSLRTYSEFTKSTSYQRVYVEETYNG